MLNVVISLVVIQSILAAYHVYVVNRGYDCYSFHALRSVFFYFPLVLFLAATDRIPFLYLWIYTFFVVEHALSLNVFHSIWQYFKLYVLRQEAPLVKHVPIYVSVKIFISNINTNFENMEVFVNRIFNSQPLFQPENGDMALIGLADKETPFELKFFGLGYVQELTFLILFCGMLFFI